MFYQILSENCKIAMGIMERKCNKAYYEHKKKIKKAIYAVAELMPKEFTDKYFVETFKWLYPNLWEDLDKQYKYWHNVGQNFSKPCKLVLDDVGVKSTLHLVVTSDFSSLATE